MKRIIKEQVKSQVKEQVSRILPRIEQFMNAQLEAKVLTRSSHSLRTSYAVTVDLSEMEQKKILIEKMEGNKSIQRLDEQRNLYKALVDAYEADKTILDSYGETFILKRRHDDDDDQEEGPSTVSDRVSKRRKEGADDQTIVQSSQHPKWFSHPKKPLTLDRDWNKTLPAVQGITQTWISELAKQADSHSSFNELLDTPLDFFNFIMNRLRVHTLTPELLAGPTFELMKGLYTSLIELKYHLEEVYKATTDQLDWVNPKGQQYPHNLLQHLPLIPDNQGLRVIPLHTSSTTTSSIFGEFYGFAVNWESALDVYSKRRIIAVTNLKIVESHSYKHLDWITVRRDDDKLYKFKEGDFKSYKHLDWITVRRDDDKLYKFKEGDFKSDVWKIFNWESKATRRGSTLLSQIRIRMQYLPQTIWRKGDKDRAAAMIQAIDKMLKTKMIMRSLESIPRAIISDSGTYFCNDQFTRVMIKYEAYENSVIYKERMKKLHDSKIKNRIFNVGDQVLLFNSHLKIFSGKLKTRWSDPFTITQVFPYGTIKLSQPNGSIFKDLPLKD
nr:reverse transcriptase domain-containing protein [Tanacetum cinerariifolium]